MILLQTLIYGFLNIQPDLIFPALLQF